MRGTFIISISRICMAHFDKVSTAEQKPIGILTRDDWPDKSLSFTCDIEYVRQYTYYVRSTSSPWPYEEISDTLYQAENRWFVSDKRLTDVVLSCP